MDATGLRQAFVGSEAQGNSTLRLKALKQSQHQQNLVGNRSDVVLVPGTSRQKVSMITCTGLSGFCEAAEGGGGHPEVPLCA